MIIVALFLPILVDSPVHPCRRWATLPGEERPALEIERFAAIMRDLINDRHDVTFQLSVRDDVTKESSTDPPF